ncbi:MAG: hypothetical protein P8Y81_12560, partial [Ignavibacteriaceae bacterium]
MINRILFLFCCFSFFSAVSFAQMTPKNYTKEFNSLTEKKVQLNAEIKDIKSDIDSLNLLIPELRQKLETEYRELY